MNHQQGNSQANLQKYLIINADDFAFSAGVDRAIIALMRQERISSTSLMSLYQPDAQSLRDLRQLRQSQAISVGLHVDLTSAQAALQHGRSMTVRQWIIKSYTRQLDVTALHNTLTEQCKRFEELMGMPPDFIDGHEHVHQFPYVREALLNIIRKRYPEHMPHIRNTTPPNWQGLKAQIIALLGARSLQQQCQKLAISQNHDFLGVYDFNPDADLASLWQHWLQQLKSSTAAESSLIMCHPSIELEGSDTISKARVQEYRYLSSDAFGNLLLEQDIRLLGFGR